MTFTFKYLLSLHILWTLLTFLYYSQHSISHFIVWYYPFYMYRHESTVPYWTISYFKAKTMFYTSFKSFAWETSSVILHSYWPILSLTTCKGNLLLWLIYSFIPLFIEHPLCTSYCARFYTQNHQKPLPTKNTLRTHGQQIKYNTES